VYKCIFGQIVFYLDIWNMPFPVQAFLDLKIPLIYNVSVYVPMEFRGRGKGGQAPPVKISTYTMEAADEAAGFRRIFLRIRRE